MRQTIFHTAILFSPYATIMSNSALLPPCPAAAGMLLSAVDTPALLLDIAAFEANARAVTLALANASQSRDVLLRPHAKAHKCLDIALLQQTFGASGVCVQKVSEAEALFASGHGGITDIFVSNQVVGKRKLARLARLAAEGCRVALCVDCEEQVEACSRAAGEVEGGGVIIDVLVEIDMGQRRCGVQPGHRVVEVAKAVARAANLRLKGIQAYHGWAQHYRDAEQRRKVEAQNAETVAPFVDAIRSLVEPHGSPVIITGGGTGTFLGAAATDLYNEVQPGSAYFMDVDYALNQPDPSLQEFGGLRHAMFVMGTVMSNGGGSHNRVVLDCGLKSHSIDSGLPWPWAVICGSTGRVKMYGTSLRNRCREIKCSDEHTQMIVDPPGESTTEADIILGDRMLLVPGHVDPTANMHDWWVVVNGLRMETGDPIDGYPKVQDVWRISARGPGF